jgi:hypothetical protein
MGENVKSSVRALLTGIVDYAGLFPPAGLSMEAAVKNYAEYHRGDLSWMLGRFIVPAARLDEFAAGAKEFSANGAWKLSVLDGGDLVETVRKIEEFNAANSAFAECDTVEIKPDGESEIERAAEILPGNLTPYFEIAPGEYLADILPVLFTTRQRAKIRTGGVTPDTIPATADVARFIRTCLAANVPFKATAGLHHPLRCTRPLTYEPDSVEGKMHGFLNVFLAAGFAREGLNSALVQEVLEESGAGAFIFEEDGVRWRKEHFLGTAQMRRLREKHAISFGSCSFTEPAEELRAMGIL